MKITLSYIMTTYNKLTYLKVTLPYLIEACKQDEEIVVVDGGSSDGTVEYLKELFDQKKIHQFISEKDFGEAHGTNKAILMAKGELLKIITDDDIFDFKVIDFCKNHLLINKEIDICGSDGIGCSAMNKTNDFIPTVYRDGFLEWKISKKPFLFCGLSYLIRRSSISKLGLLSTQFKIIDLEYSARVSSLNANIVFCNAYSFANIVGIDSNSSKFFDAIKQEKKILKYLYKNISNLNYSIELKHIIKTNVQNLLGSKKIAQPIANFSYTELVKDSTMALLKINSKIEFSFL
ncbi:MAG: glycosyltransferase [Bacteroidia bacterium]|nr:glycosyltransferase [Bacteroidia bacterium]